MPFVVRSDSAPLTPNPQTLADWRKPDIQIGDFVETILRMYDVTGSNKLLMLGRFSRNIQEKT